MPTLSAAQIAGLVVAPTPSGAAFGRLTPNDSDAPIAVAIALAESAGKTDAKGGPNRNGTYDWGLWQINDVHSPTAEQKTNPDANWSLAYKISNGGTDWSPWSSYKNGTYRTYLLQAQQAVDDPDWSGSQLGDHPAVEAGEAIDATAEFFKWIADPKLWTRVALVIGGAIMLLIALWQIGTQS